MKLTLATLIAFALLGASGGLAHELLPIRGGLRAFSSSATPLDELIEEGTGEMCSKCKDKSKCTTDATLEISCTSKDGSESSSSASSTSISSKKEFREANVCKGACAPGLRCHARWQGSYHCGADEGEPVFFAE